MTDKFERAIELLRTIVKDSHLKNQKHLDLTLASPEEQIACREALMILEAKVENGEMTREQLLHQLGLV